MTKVQEMADPKVPEHHLTPQGRIYGRVTRTDEKTPEVAPDFKGHGATPQQKEDENKSWISEGHTTADVDEQNSNEKGEPQPDVYAQRVNQSLGPLTSVKDKIADTLESGKEKISGSAHMASEAKDSTKVNFFHAHLSISVHFPCCVTRYFASVNQPSSTTIDDERFHCRELFRCTLKRRGTR